GTAGARFLRTRRGSRSKHPAGCLVEPAKGPDQNQNRDGNAEQPQEKITAHWMISDWIGSLNECRFLERVPLLAVSLTRASLAGVRFGTDFQPQRSWLGGESGCVVDKRTGFLVAAAL